MPDASVSVGPTGSTSYGSRAVDLPIRGDASNPRVTRFDPFMRFVLSPGTSPVGAALIRMALNEQERNQYFLFMMW